MAVLTDPRIRELAEIFVDDVINEGCPPHIRRLIPRREAFVDRAAAAMQQAIEDECTAIRIDLHEAR